MQMKRTTIIGKKQILSVAMVLALSAAVWLNVKYATNGTEFGGTTSIKDSELGSAKYVANTNVKTENEQNYFEKAISLGNIYAYSNIGKIFEENKKK